jgi:hypothetical protein
MNRTLRYVQMLLVALAIDGAVSPSRAERAESQLRCVGHCDVYLERGFYRLTLLPSSTTVAGTESFEVAQAGSFRIEGVRRDQRVPALLLGSSGVALALLGVGALIGSYAEPTARHREAWFWTGAAAAGAGFALVPIGFSRYRTKPSVEPLAAHTLRPHVTGSSDERGAAAGTTKPAAETVEEPRWGLVTAGALTFAASYGLTGAIGAGALAGGSDAKYAKLFIPVIGPILLDRDGGAWGAVPQLVGLTLAFIGAASSRTVVVGAERSVALCPWLTRDSGGFAFASTF